MTAAATAASIPRIIIPTTVIASTVTINTAAHTAGQTPRWAMNSPTGTASDAHSAQTRLQGFAEAVIAHPGHTAHTGALDLALARGAAGAVRASIPTSSPIAIATTARDGVHRSDVLNHTHAIVVALCEPRKALLLLGLDGKLCVAQAVAVLAPIWSTVVVLHQRVRHGLRIPDTLGGHEAWLGTGQIAQGDEGAGHDVVLVESALGLQ